jgi:hypothetical protein
VNEKDAASSKYLKSSFLVKKSEAKSKVNSPDISQNGGVRSEDALPSIIRDKIILKA